MNIFEQFESIDKQIENIKEKSDNKNEQLLSVGQGGSAMGGMGFGGTLHHNGASISGMIDGQIVNLHQNGPMTSGSIGGQQVTSYTDHASTFLY